MTDIYIICVEDEKEVLDVILMDLAPLEEVFPVEVASSADEAKELISEIRAGGGKIGIALCDHVMPGENGVDLLIQMQKDEFTRKTRKILLTGQAGLEATVKAVNNAGLNRYIAKPWDPEDLIRVIKEELTKYVIENEKNLLPFMGILDSIQLQEEIRKRGYV